MAGERGGHPGEGGAGVLVHLEVLAAGVLRDLLEADLEGVPGRLGDVQAEDGGASVVESRAGRVVVGVELHRAALQPAEAVAEEEDRLRAGDGKKRAAEGEKGLLRRRGVEGLLAVEGAASDGGSDGGSGPGQRSRTDSSRMRRTASRSGVKSRCRRRCES